MLWLLGGVAQLEGEPRTPGADFRIAVVGPSPAWGSAWCSARSVPSPRRDADGLVVGGLGYLAGTNILLAVFNLIPAAPLDEESGAAGGTVARSGNREAAITAGRAAASSAS